MNVFIVSIGEHRMPPHLIKKMLKKALTGYENVLEIRLNSCYSYLRNMDDPLPWQIVYSDAVMYTEVWVRKNPEGFKIYRNDVLLQGGVGLETVTELWKVLGCPNEILISNRFRGLEAYWLNFSTNCEVDEIWIKEQT